MVPLLILENMYAVGWPIGYKRTQMIKMMMENLDTMKFIEMDCVLT